MPNATDMEGAKIKNNLMIIIIIIASDMEMEKTIAPDVWKVQKQTNKNRHKPSKRTHMTWRRRGWIMQLQQAGGWRRMSGSLYVHVYNSGGT